MGESIRQEGLTMRAVRTVAPAKVNLYLGIENERDESGYHRATSVMCALGLADDVTVTLMAEPGISLSCTPDPVADPRDNLAWRAADELARALGQQACLHIEIVKRVPAQAGLGGGSSDAAAVLRCLEELWDARDQHVLVERVARSLGADVPFFLQDQVSLLTGRGDVVQEVFSVPSLDVVLARPDAGVSTAAAYRAFDQLGTELPDLEPMLTGLRGMDGDLVVRSLANNLAPAACSVEPKVGETLAFLSGQVRGSERVLLCGSGSCCAAFVENAERAEKIASQARGLGLQVWVTRTRTEPWAAPLRV